MNDFEQEITQLTDVSRIIDLSCEYIEGLEVDNAVNLLIALKLLLEDKENKLHNLFQKVWKEFITPLHAQEMNHKQTWTVKIENDGTIIFPESLVKKIGFKEWDLVDIYFNKEIGSIVIEKVSEK